MVGLLMTHSCLLLGVLCTPCEERPKKAAKILDREDQGERSGDDFKMPKNRHRDRHERPVEHGSEHEAFRVQAPAGNVEHAEAADEQSGKAKVVCGLIAARWGEQYEGAFDQYQPTEDFYSFCRAALPFGAE